MKKLTILFIFFNSLGYGQILGKLYYNTTPSSYVPAPIKERQEFMKKRETSYYENRNYCNQIENFIIVNLQKLTIDSINTIYRDGLQRNLKKIQKLKDEGHYEEYTVLLMDIMDDLKSNDLYYKSEDVYRNQLLEDKIKKQNEETERLKQELEFQKSLNQTKSTKKSIKKK